MDYEIIIKQKNTEVITVTIQENGSAYDLTGKRVVLTVKDNVNDPDSSALIQKTFTGGDATGIATFNLTSDDTDLTAKTYWYDLMLVSASKGIVLSTQRGAFKVRGAITQDVPSF